MTSNHVIIQYPNLGYKPSVKYNTLVSRNMFTNQQERLQNLLRQVRLDARLTQTELAKHLGQPQSFVSKYESGERRLDLMELHYICAAVGISLQELVRRFEEQQNETSP